MAVETLPLAPALAAWENEGGAPDHREGDRAIERSIPPETRDALPDARPPEPREGDAIDQLINVLDTHRDSAKEDRKARGEAFKDEPSSE